jgi:hypothetical protein
VFTGLSSCAKSVTTLLSRAVKIEHEHDWAVEAFCLRDLFFVSCGRQELGNTPLRRDPVGSCPIGSRDGLDCAVSITGDSGGRDPVVTLDSIEDHRPDPTKDKNADYEVAEVPKIIIERPKELPDSARKVELILN